MRMVFRHERERIDFKRNEIINKEDMLGNVYTI